MKSVFIFCVLGLSVQFAHTCRAQIKLYDGDKFHAMDKNGKLRTLHIVDVDEKANGIGRFYFSGNFHFDWARSKSNPKTHEVKGVLTGFYLEKVVGGTQYIEFNGGGYFRNEASKLTFPKLTGVLQRPVPGGPPADNSNNTTKLVPTNGDNNVVAVLTTTDPADGGGTQESDYEP